jgi:hypothetical protein
VREDSFIVTWWHDVHRRLAGRRLALLALALSALVALALALTSPVSRDETMYLAAASFVGAGASLHAEIHFLQAPLAAWLHAGVQSAWPGPEVLLPARLAQAVIVLVLGCVLVRVLRRVGASLALAAALVLLLVHADVMRDSLGLARNHELALTLSLAPWLVLPLAAGDSRVAWRWTLAGALAAAAVATRLTHAAPALLVLAWPWCSGGDRREAAWTATGGAVVLVAVAATLAWRGADPTALRFGLVDYHLANARFHAAHDLGRGLDLAGKWHDAARFWRHTDLAAWSALLLAALAPTVWRPSAWRRPAWRLGTGLLLSGVVMVAVPRPLQTSYYAPLLLAGAVTVAASAAGCSRGRRRALQGVALVAALVATVHHAGDDLRRLTAAVRPARWPTTELQAAGERLAAAVGDVDGKTVVATQGLLVLEAGLPLDPAFATGEFVWRLGGVDHGPARVVTTANVARHLDAHPPAAVLVDAHARWDGPLAAWVRARGGRLHPVAGGVVVWTPLPPRGSGLSWD